MAWKLKLLKERIHSLRLLAIALSVVSTILLGASFPLTGKAAAYYFYWDGYGPVIVSMPFAATAWVIVYGVSILLVVIIRGSYHPGIDIGMDFMGWSITLVMSGFLLGYMGSYNPTQYPCDNSYGQNTPHRCSQARALMGMSLTAGLLLVIVGIIEFYLFVVACKATHIRRITKERELFVELGDIGPKRRRSR